MTLSSWRVRLSPPLFALLAAVSPVIPGSAVADTPGGRAPISDEDLPNVESFVTTFIAGLLAQNEETISQLMTRGDAARVLARTEGRVPELQERIAKLREIWSEKYKSNFALAPVSYAMTQGATDQVLEVVLPARNQLPEVQLRLMRESSTGSVWRLDIPDDLTSGDIQWAVADVLSELLRERDSWPAHEEDAHEFFAQSILRPLAYRSRRSIGPERVARLNPERFSRAALGRNPASPAADTRLPEDKTEFAEEFRSGPEEPSS